MTWIWKDPGESGEHPAWLGSDGEIGSETPWGAGAARAEATRPRKMAYFIAIEYVQDRCKTFQLSTQRLLQSEGRQAVERENSSCEVRYLSQVVTGWDEMTASGDVFE